MSRRATRLAGWLALLIATILITPLVLNWVANRSRPDGQHVEEEVRESLPIGSTASQVKAFAKQHNLKFIDDPGKTDLIVCVDGLKGDSPFLKLRILFVFHFDAQSHLRDIESKRID